jgi:hypothetical protein
VGGKIVFNEVFYDKESKKVNLVYSTGFKTTVTDSGPILLCVINRLLKTKYEFYLSLPKDKTISRYDLALLNHAANLLPEDEKKELQNAIKAYIQDDSNENGSKIFKVLNKGMRTGMKDHKTTFKSVSYVASPVTQELIGKKTKLDKKITAISDGKSESELDDDEKQIFRKLKRDALDLEKKIKEAKPEEKIEEGTEVAIDWTLCLHGEGSKSQTFSSNKNIEALLKKIKTVLKQVVPVGNKANGDH